jgi:hypothetical protein
MAVISPPLAIRTRYLGKYAADPTPTEVGCWYYNTASNFFRYWNGTVWVTWPSGGFTLWDGTGTTTLVAATAGDYVMTITAPLLTTITYILDINIDTNPVCDPGSVTNKVITGNVVGFTLVGVGMGTTLTAQLLAVGT